MRIVRHTLPNGDIVQDRFNDATSAIIEPVNSEPVLILRNKDGAAIASFDASRVIKCSKTAATNAPLQVKPDGEANFYTLLNGARWIARVQLNGEFTTTQQEQIMQQIAAAFPPL